MIRKKNKYLIREISWLSFNNRVLQEVYNENTPLIERIRFLAIFSSNLDEFFRVRVAHLTRVNKLTRGEKLYYGEKPANILDQIYSQVKQQHRRIEDIYHTLLIPALVQQKIYVVNENLLSPEQSEFVKFYFKEKILPELSPVLLQQNEHNLQLKDSAINLVVILRGVKKEKKYALIEIPGNLSRFITLPSIGKEKYIILLDDVIRHCLGDIFGILGYDTFRAYTIKIVRDAELELDEDLSLSILDNLSKSLKQRKKGSPVRFTFDKSMPQKLLEFILRNLAIKTPNIIPGGRYHNFRDFMKFPNVGGPKLEFKPSPPLYKSDIDLNRSLLEQIREKSLLVSLPYESFDYVLYFLMEAAIDPDVTSIKITLYRVASGSRIINALLTAAKNGKKVVALVELKARFDEESNIYWTQQLEEAGVHVLNGLPQMKVHSKICLVTRKNGKTEEKYGLFGTGNYNEKTGRQYADYHYFTTKKSYTNDLDLLFRNLERNILALSYKTISVAPLGIRKKINALIDKEIRLAKNGKNSYIIMKMNSLTDIDMINKLYEAGKAGVIIRLIVRGICCLIPQKKGLSENIEVISIVDKFLEHARVFIFSNEGTEAVFLSSTDLMTRNLDHRIEVFFPLMDAESKKIVKDMIDIQLKDNVKARIIDENFSNKFREKENPSEPSFRSQTMTYTYFSERNKLKIKSEV